MPLSTEIYPRPNARTLVVLLHGFGGSPRGMDDIRRHVVRANLHDADILVPVLPYRRAWAMRRLSATVSDLVQVIDDRWRARMRERGSGYDRIVLIGHSGGSLLARAILVNAWGLATQAPRAEPLEWAPVIERIIMVSGLNRGWSRETPLGPYERARFAVGMAMADILSPLGEGTIFDLHRGAPFLTALRLDWLELRKRLASDGPHARSRSPIMVQLLGTLDDLVNPTDHFDVHTGDDFLYLEMPGTGHHDAVHVAPGERVVNGRDFGRIRRDIISLALTGTREAIAAASVSADAAVPDGTRLKVEPEVSDVVFVVHGIRDYGFWSQKIGREILQCARVAAPERSFAFVNPSYGYFPIGDFLQRRRRREKVQWLMDKYVEVKRRYPNARISYVGHSNGTYLLARALEDYPFARFHRIVFAGSVVRRRYPWAHHLGQRVTGVLNLVATGDWVVASVPRALQPLYIFDLGSAGHDGFASPDVHNASFVAGGHSAGIGEPMWGDIARFIVDGKLPDAARDADFRQSRAGWVISLGALSAPVILGLVAAILGLLYALLSAIFGLPMPSQAAANPTYGYLLAQPNVAWISLLALLAMLWTLMRKL